jgi:cell division protein FtsN
MLKMIEGPTLPLYARYILATVVVIWVSLAGGSWLGRALIASEVFGEKDEQVEFRSMPEPRARPWVKVDPELEKEIEALREAAGPSLMESLSKESKAPVKTSPAASKDPSVLATPSVGEAVAPKGKVMLQFGSFADPDNAERLREQLTAQGQESSVEKVDSKTGLLYRVKGPAFDNPEEAERVARNLRMQSFQVMVVGE